jgi:hypothetical protein
MGMLIALSPTLLYFQTITEARRNTETYNLSELLNLLWKVALNVMLVSDGC